MDTELIAEIIWVMENYGSDAGERTEPGSKLRSQAERIAQFVYERAEVQDFIDRNEYRLVKVVSWTTNKA